jgi:GNAT superfamily N-acetyltransferase
MIRPARADELPLLQDIENAAGEVFRTVGMDAVADHEPPSVAVLRRYLSAGTIWVSTDEHDHPIGYLVADVIDGNAHIEQVSVHPDHAGRRLGAGLVEQAVAWARQDGRPAITLTTFAELAWNAPYYERLGFRRLTQSEVTPGLRKVREAEAAIGLDDWPRVCMRRDL